MNIFIFKKNVLNALTTYLIWIILQMALAYVLKDTIKMK